MLAIVHVRSHEVRLRLHQAVKLRWPQARIVAANSKAELLHNAASADVIFVEWDSSCQAGLGLFSVIKGKYASAIMVVTEQPLGDEAAEVLEAGADSVCNATQSPSLIAARVNALVRFCVRCNRSRSRRP